MLVGRDSERIALTDLLKSAGDQRGGCVVLRGEAGIGKTALLRYVVERAEAAGMRVLSVSGVPAEVQIAYGSLDRVLRPLRIGIGADVPPVRVAVELLDLLGSMDEPVLLAVEDAHWLDEASWDAVTFLARRLGSDSVAVVMAVRDSVELDRRVAAAALPVMRLEALDRGAAGALLDAVVPGLPPALAERVLAQANGNPLGLVELGTAAARRGASALVSADLPLTAQVEQTFTGLVADLPEVARSLLLVAALDDGDDLDEILAAASRLSERPVTADDIGPAVTARLVDVDDRYRVTFRHPLLRSALRQSAPAAARRRVHTALADSLGDAPDRRIWHRAAAATGPDEALAGELTTMAVDAYERQAASIARSALEHAVRLSGDPSERGHRLIWAAQLAHDQGDAEAFGRLLAAVDEQRLHSHDRARLAWMRQTHLGAALSGDTDRLAHYTDALEAMLHTADADQVVHYVNNLALQYYWSNPAASVRDRLVRILDGLELPADDTGRIRALAHLAPVDRGPDCLARTTAALPGLDLTSGQQYDLGAAASALGAYPVSTAFLTASAIRMRAGGLLGTLVGVLTGLAFNAVGGGDVRAAMTSAAEALALATETDEPSWALTALLCLGTAHALHGDNASAAAAADTGEQALTTAGMFPMLSLVQRIRGIDALAAGRPTDAFRHLHRVFDPADRAHHPYLRFALVGHLAEAALGGGALGELRPLVPELEDLATRSRSPVLEAGLVYARAVLADSAAGFETALAADLGAWPFERARLRLAYGGWLRRQRRAADSRPLLRDAAATFDALGATPWADRARVELRASGETLRKPVDAAALLTPQELQIARLAADGLSNREIAERLFLSRRTVTTHLYRIFPKVGVKSRGELGRILAD